VHLLPHFPQWCLSDIGFTHLPLQHTCEYLHFFPHMPQLFLSLDTFTHFFLQQSGPSLPLARQTLGYLSQVMAPRPWRLLAPRREANSSLSEDGVTEFFVLLWLLMVLRNGDSFWCSVCESAVTKGISMATRKSI